MDRTDQHWHVQRGPCHRPQLHHELCQAGEKYVFVNKGQVFQIQNQDFNDLEKHAGHTVKLTGELGSDGKTKNVAMAPGTQKYPTSFVVAGPSHLTVYGHVTTLGRVPPCGWASDGRGAFGFL